MNDDEIRRYAIGLENKIEQVKGICFDAIINGSLGEKRLARTLLSLIGDDDG
jgi:hypothetical protein